MYLDTYVSIYKDVIIPTNIDTYRKLRTLAQVKLLFMVRGKSYIFQKEDGFKEAEGIGRSLSGFVTDFDENM